MNASLSPRDEIVTVLQAIDPPDPEVLRALLRVPRPAHVQSSAVRTAAAGGHLDALKMMAQAGYSLDDDQHYSAVLAAQGGHLEVLRYLASEEVSLRHHDDDALVAACGCGDARVVAYLLSMGCSPAAQGGVILFALAAGQTETVELLLRSGVSLAGVEEQAVRQICCFAGDSPLGCIDQIWPLVPSSMFTSIALPLLAASGDLDSVRHLLARGCDPTFDDCRAMRVALNADQEAAADLLLNAALDRGDITMEMVDTLDRQGYGSFIHVARLELDGRQATSPA